MYERGKRSNFNLNWWAGKALESWEEGLEDNPNWTNVEGFENQQLLSGRAKLLTGDKARESNLQTGDVILLDWGNNGLLDHAVIVNENDEGPVVSSETANRRSVPWKDMTRKIIPNFMRERVKEEEEKVEKGEIEAAETTAWRWEILRPTFRASNRR